MNRSKSKAIAGIIVILLFTISFLSCSTKKEYKNIGDVIELVNCEITIEKAEKLDAVEYVVPKEGSIFIAIKFNYKNITQESLEYKSLPLIDLQSEDGGSYNINYDASNVYALMQGVDYSIMTEQLDKDTVRHDAEVYEVPKNELAEKEIVIKIDNTNYYIKVENLTQIEDETQNES